MDGRWRALLLLFPTIYCFRCYNVTLTGLQESWRVEKGLTFSECSRGCLFEEVARGGGFLFKLGCYPRFDTIGPSGCESYPGKAPREKCICLHHGCNGHLLVYRHPEILNYFLEINHEAHPYEQIGKLEDCLKSE
ncbi:hypothetical protein V3C99_010475 [Haemonchus contortus]